MRRLLIPLCAAAMMTGMIEGDRAGADDCAGSTILQDGVEMVHRTRLTDADSLAPHRLNPRVEEDVQVLWRYRPETRSPHLGGCRIDRQIKTWSCYDVP
jgi:hypothetical protein